MINELRKSILENTEYYRRVKVNNLKFRQSLHVLLATVDRISDISKTINGFACDYDLDEKTKGNGHHSFVYVCDKALNRTAKICRQITETRESFFFRISFYQRWEWKILKFFLNNFFYWTKIFQLRFILFNIFNAILNLSKFSFLENRLNLSNETVNFTLNNVFH